jgi:hypothetical protein
MWGDVVRGKKVIRAQYARVLCLTEVPDPWAHKPGVSDPEKATDEERERREATILAALRAYGVPRVPFESVECYAREFGEEAGEDHHVEPLGQGGEQ